MSESPRQKFERLQTRAQDADRKVTDLRLALERQYQDDLYAPAGKRRELERLKVSASKHESRYFEYLQVLSPRRWEQGVPYRWIRDVLTYDDAVTTDALSVVPPPAYGYQVQDSQRFAAPLHRTVSLP